MNAVSTRDADREVRDLKERERRDEQLARQAFDRQYTEPRLRPTWAVIAVLAGLLVIATALSYLLR